MKSQLTYKLAQINRWLNTTVNTSSRGDVLVEGFCLFSLALLLGVSVGFNGITLQVMHQYCTSNGVVNRGN